MTTRTIESQDGRYRATAEATEDGIRCQFLRHGGGVCQADAAGMAVRWRILQTFTIDDQPFHVVLDNLERLVWPMQDDRPRAWPVRSR